MANFKVKNGLQAGRYLLSGGTETAGADGPYGVFSTTTYTGTGAAQTISNGIDLSGDGGLVWVKRRDSTSDHELYDTERGATYSLSSNATYTSTLKSTGLTTFNSTGFTVGSRTNVNASGGDIASWTFKKEPSFFDVVTYTGDGVAGRTVSHSLGSIPGMIIVKSTSLVEPWAVYHKGLNGGTTPQNYHIRLTTGAEAADPDIWNNTAPTSSAFTTGANDKVNANNQTYVAYLFGHDTSEDGLIQCGSYTGDGSDTNREINVGFKPSWLMIKNTTSAYNWIIIDSVRGEGEDPPTANVLAANISNAEDPAGDRLFFSDNGFTLSTSSFDYNKSGDNFIYIAIRAVVPTQTLDLSTGHTFSITPTEALDILFTNPPASGKAIGFSVEINGDGSAITWPSSVKWPSGVAPTATASKEVYAFVTTDGGTSYYGKLAGSDIA